MVHNCFDLVNLRKKFQLRWSPRPSEGLTLKLLVLIVALAHKTFVHVLTFALTHRAFTFALTFVIAHNTQALWLDTCLAHRTCIRSSWLLLRLAFTFTLGSQGLPWLLLSLTRFSNSYPSPAFCPGSPRLFLRFVCCHDSSRFYPLSNFPG